MNVLFSRLTVSRLTRLLAVVVLLGAGLVLSARADTLVEVPVLNVALGIGDIIGARDIEVVALPYGKVPRNAITDPEELVGKSPKRLLRPGLPVRVGDVAPPIVIKKNTVVVMVFDRAGLFLTAKGKALQNGAVGEVIRVENVQSGIAVQGVVQPDGRVVVGFGDSIAFN
ncbi:MAG: flagellar basal body P-ring formation chaperone FlgA [Alphaproteobacteria bacterium]